MNIVVVGLGYVGLVSAVCFSEMGNKVICVDNDVEKIKKLKKGIIPIYEPRLEYLVLKNIEDKNLFFSTNLKDTIKDAEVLFIAVGTPMSEDGSADLQYVLEVSKEIGKTMEQRLVVVNKSTVPVGTADKVKITIQKELDIRNCNLEFDVVSNPEFLKEGTAVSDSMKPDRVIIGSESKYASEIMKSLYSPFFRISNRMIFMDIRSAEMTKYAANAMLATKISFINEIANICEKVGADVNKVREGIGSDQRIGYSFIYPGVGYGGSCFPKDLKALKKTAEENGYQANLITSVQNINDAQKLVISQKIIKRFGEDLKDFTFGLWGLTFKPETDDMRESPAIYVIRELTKRGAKVKAYDPKATEQAKKYHLKGIKNIFHCKSKYEVLENADALILLTEWKEFRTPNFSEIQKKLKFPIIFDGRNQYNNLDLEKKGFEYFQIGKRTNSNTYSSQKIVKK